jgi:hypothetical protein
MNFYNIICIALLFFNSFFSNKPQESQLKNYTEISSTKRVSMVYNTLKSNHFQLPNLESFSKAIQGFYLLKERGLIKKNFLTIIDFSLSSRTKRMWIIDMVENKIIFNSLVAHGKNSGNDIASNFSNKSESNKSSLGFFATGEVYNGKHGMSLKLDGLEKGINDNARRRAVVVHGANYVSDAFLKNHNRLGRSQGCPAIPFELSKKIIQTIKDKSCLFIYHPSMNYLQSSKLIS